MNSFGYSIDLISVLTKKEIQVKYKNHILGYFWSVAHPLAYALTLYFVFKVFMRFNIPYYALFLIAGLFPWQAFTNSLTVSTNVYLSNGPLIKKIQFPRYFLVLSTLLNDTFHFLMSLPVVFLFICLYGILDWKIAWWLVFIPLNLISQLLLTFGLSLFAGTLNLFFRDLERLVQIFLNLWFYVTPIFYSLDIVSPKAAILLKLNPMALIVLNWHEIFVRYHFNWLYWGISLIPGILACALGILVYQKLNLKFSEVL